MLMPSIFGNDMFGDFFTDPWFDEKEFKDMQKKLYGHSCLLYTSPSPRDCS